MTIDSPTEGLAAELERKARALLAAEMGSEKQRQHILGEGSAAYATVTGPQAIRAILAALNTRSTPPVDTAVEGELERLREDAAKWRSLISCQRMRVIGRTLDNNHIGMEFWREHEAAHPCAEFPQDDCRAKFQAFALNEGGSNVARG